MPAERIAGRRLRWIERVERSYFDALGLLIDVLVWIVIDER